MARSRTHSEVEPTSRSARQPRQWQLEDAFTFVGYVVLTLWAILALFPLYWMIKNSLEPNQLLSIWPPRILPNWDKLTLDNYLALLQRFPLPRWFFNSIIVAVMRTA